MFYGKTKGACVVMEGLKKTQFGIQILIRINTKLFRISSDAAARALHINPSVEAKKLLGPIRESLLSADTNSTLCNLLYEEEE